MIRVAESNDALSQFSSVITAFMNHYNLTRIVMICSVETIWITTCESIKSRIAADKQ